MENTVETMLTQVQDDAALTAQETTTTTLADVLGATDEPAAQPAEAPVETTPQTEPGWMRKRIDAAVKKANSELEAKLRAEYDAQLAPLREAQLVAEADKLVADGKISDREMALNYLRATKNIPTPVNSEPPATASAARDEKGRFVSTKPDAETQQRAATLVTQADALSRSSGVDVMALYNSNPDIKQKIVSGEWDFVDVLKHAQSHPSVPSPVRNTNSMGIGNMKIGRMSDDQFDKLNAMLAEGQRIDAR
jgi:hypothetical protein